jgi:flagellar motor protein MotB
MIRSVFLFLGVSLLLACNPSNDQRENAADNDTVTVKENDRMSAVEKKAIDFNELDWNSPVVKYEEIDGDEVKVRSRSNYSIYSLDENKIFRANTADLDEKGIKVLENLAASLNKRYMEGDIRIYSATYDDEAKNEMAGRRAIIVRDFLITAGQIPGNRISFSESNENNPVGDNRRNNKEQMEIVVLSSE